MNNKVKTKTIIIDGIPIPMKISGATYLKFRNEFHEDMFAKLQRVNESEGRKNEEGQIEYQLSGEAIETLLQIAYIMARQGTPTMETSFEDWLDQFSFSGTMSEGLQGVLAMVNNDQETLEEAKKNTDQPQDQ